MSDMPAHSVVVIDDRGNPGDEYWLRSHAARIGPDGNFRIAIENPAGRMAISGSSSASTMAW